MRKFKKLLVGVCTTAFCLSAIVMPVSAESKDYYSEPGSYEYVLPSYTQPYRYDDVLYFSKNPEKDKRIVLALYEKCRVKDPSKWYEDTAIIEEAEKAIKAGKYVYDLKRMADFGITYTLKNETDVFNYGICITDINKYYDDDFKKICKCSKQDYEELFYDIKGREMKENEYSITDARGDRVCIYSFNPTSNILTWYIKRK